MPSLNFTGQFMHHSMHMLSQVMLCFNWLRVILLQSSANLWPRSLSTGQIFCANCSLSMGFTHMRVSPLLSGPRFAMLPTGYYTERLSAFLSLSLYLSLFFISASASPRCFLSPFAYSLFYPLREWSVCVDLRGASNFSGPHLSAFTVLTFSRAGFIGELGPVKNLASHYHVCTRWSLKLGVCE